MAQLPTIKIELTDEAKEFLDALKSFNLSERREAIDRAFYEMFPPPQAYIEPAQVASGPWVVEYLDDAVIIMDGDKFYRAPYTVNGKQVELAPRSEWVEAQSKTEWVAVAKSLQERQEPVVYMGAEVKALGGGRVGGYLVRYSTDQDPDLTGDYFTGDTDFGEHATTPVLYHHGQDTKVGKRPIGAGALRRDEVGVWIEAQLSLRDEYEKAIYELAEKGILGWSSGVPGHLMEREPHGKAYKITRWPLGLDASLTPTPAEPRNTAVPLKSLSVPLPELTEPTGEAEAAGDAAQSDGDGGAEASTIKTADTTQEGDIMTPEEIQGLIDAAAKKGAEEALKALPTNGSGGVAVVQDEADRELELRPFKSFGEQLKAVIEHDAGRKIDKRILALKQLGLNEGLPSEGGVFVQTDFNNELLRQVYETGLLASRVRRIPVSANANGTKINAVAETSRATGSRWGGIQTYWLGEAGTKTPSMPAFREVRLDLKKLIGLCYLTDELLQDTVAMESIVTQAFAEEFGWMVDEAVVRGTGAGQPLGFLVSPALVTVAAEPGQPIDTIVHENIVKMWARMPARNRANAMWLYNQDCEPSLFTMGLAVGTGGVPSFMPPGGLSGSPYASLMGRPALAIEQADTVGDVGDIMLVDLKQYAMIDKGGVQTASSIHVQFLTDQTALRFVYRCDGQPTWVAPITPANSANQLSPFIALAAR